VSLLWNNMTYIQNTHGFRGFKLITDWLQFSLIEELTYEIDVWFQEEILTNDARLHLQARLLRRSYLVGSLFQGSYTSIFITYSLVSIHEWINHLSFLPDLFDGFTSIVDDSLTKTELNHETIVNIIVFWRIITDLSRMNKLKVHSLVN
jgi:hypothetical protein